MSIRPTARIRVRRNRFKFRRIKSEDNLLKNLLKKRLELSLLQLRSAVQSSTKLENLPFMVTGVYSNDNDIQLKATIQLRKLLDIEPDPIDEVVQSGVVPRLVEFLTREDFPMLQVEAAWLVTIIISGTPEHTKVVIDHGAVSIFVKLLASSPSDDVRKQAVWALGNIAAISPGCRDIVLGEGALIPLLFQLNERADLSMLRNATLTLSRFCSGKPQPQFEQIKPALPTFECLLQSKDKEVLKNACWALSCLSCAKKEQKQAMIDAGICKRLVELLHHDPSPEILISALQSIGYIMAGGHIQIQAVIETGVIAPLVKLLQTAEYDNVIEEAAWVLSFATSLGTNKQIKYFVDQGCIKPLCALLVRSHSKSTLFACLEVVENILKLGEEEKNSAGEVNIYKDLIEDAEGLEKIKILQSGYNDLVYGKVAKILETYWLEDFQKCVKVKAGQIRLS